TAASLETGQRLPLITIQPADGGTPVPLRKAGRLATVLVTVHPDCAECSAYLESLRDVQGRVEEWDGRVIAARATEELAAAGVPAPAVLIADQWGELFRGRACRRGPCLHRAGRSRRLASLPRDSMPGVPGRSAVGRQASAGRIRPSTTQPERRFIMRRPHLTSRAVPSFSLAVALAACGATETTDDRTADPGSTGDVDCLDAGARDIVQRFGRA